MALVTLSGDQHRSIFTQLCNVLDPGVAVALSSVSNELWTATKGLLPQLRADHEAAAALCLKMGHRSCKELREAKKIKWIEKGLSVADLALLGTLGSVLPALEVLVLTERSAGPEAGPDGVQQLAMGLGVGALPAVTELLISGVHMGDAGASALAAALGQGVMPRLENVMLDRAAIGDAGLVALAPALQRRPALLTLILSNMPFGDKGLAALVASPPPAGALPPPARLLTKLKLLDLEDTQVSDAGCAALAAALDGGVQLPALESLTMGGCRLCSAAAKKPPFMRLWPSRDR